MTLGRTQSPTRWVAVGSLGAWTAAWDELVDSAPVPTPFLRSWWLSAVSDQTAQFVLFLDGSELVGGVALERRFGVPALPVYQFMGGGPLCPDHLDALAAPGHKDAVCAALREWWQRPGARVLYADGLAEESLLERTFGPDTTTVIDVAPWDVLPTDPDEYFAARSQNLRKSMRKAENRFSRLGIRHHQVGQEDLASALDDFVRLQQRRGDRQALLAEMRRLSHAIAAGVAAGEVEVDVLQSPDTIVAVWISFFHAGALRYYQSARLLDPDFRDAGSILLLEVVRRAIRQGCRELDLLRGAEPYKMRFVDRQRQIKRLHMAHGLAGQALLQALGAARTARAAGRRAWQRAAGFAG